MNKIKYFFVMLCLLLAGGMSAQEQHPAAVGGAPEYVGYTQVYDFIEELAELKIISVSSVVKPYDRNQIAAWLMEAAEAEELLSVRQRKELRFYLNDFALEREGMYDGAVQWSNAGKVVNHELWRDFYQITDYRPLSPLDSSPNLGEQLNSLTPHSSLFSLSMFQPAFHYADRNFECKINPILGMDLTMNGHGMVMHRWYGAEIRADIVDHVAVWGSIRDHSYSGEHLDEEYFKSVGQSKRQGALLSQPGFLNNLPGGRYHAMSYGGDYGDVRAGIKAYSWWGSIGLVKDKLQWGDSYNSSIILSGRAPSFPMIELKLNPCKWFRLDYIHGWLVSEEKDSTSYYIESNPITGIDKKLYNNARKYIAANMLTFIPVKGLNLSVGSSVIYGNSNLFAAMSLPVSFFNSIDYQMASSNDNSQIFLNISTRNLKHTHLYASVFVDEFNVSRLKKSNPEHNFIGWKVGARVSNWPIEDLSVMAEFTRVILTTYNHPIELLKYTSNGYGLGHYLGDNSQELYIALRYKPVRSLNLELGYVGAVKYNQYYYDRHGEFNYAKSFDEKVWRNDEVKLHAVYEVVNNAYAFVDVGLNNARGFTPESEPVVDEIRLDAEGYLRKYTPAFYWGWNMTLKMGFSFYY